MNRRRFLADALAVGGLAALGGCTEQTLAEAKSRAKPFEGLHYEEVDLPVEQRYGQVEEGVLLAEDASVTTLDEFAGFLDKEGVAVEDVSEDEAAGETMLSLEYVVGESDHSQAVEVGLVAGAYAAFVEAAFDGEELVATLLDSEGASFGEFTVKTEAAERYAEGEASAATYGKETLKELKST